MQVNILTMPMSDAIHQNPYDTSPFRSALRPNLRIPEHLAGHSDNIRPPKPGYPATHV